MHWTGSYADTPGDDPWPLDDDGYCVPGCPDDVCRNSGHCAWSSDGPPPRTEPSGSSSSDPSTSSEGATCAGSGC